MHEQVNLCGLRLLKERDYASVYPMDLLRKIIFAYENGEESVITIAKRFKVAKSTIDNCLKINCSVADVCIISCFQGLAALTHK